jgi:glycerol-3-phosphate dehydrogenase
VKAVVVGAESWGTAFACLLADRGHQVTLATRDPQQARVMSETGRNPRNLTTDSLSGVRPTTIADAPTFAGLADMGDLIVTCWSRHGRNRRAGERIAHGATPEEAAAEIGQVVEGLTTAPVLRDLSRRLEIELPITEGVCEVLSGRSLDELAAGLMGRRPTAE